MQVMSDLLVPLMADLARLVSTRSKEFPGRAMAKRRFQLHVVACDHSDAD